MFRLLLLCVSLLVLGPIGYAASGPIGQSPLSWLEETTSTEESTTSTTDSTTTDSTTTESTTTTDSTTTDTTTTDSTTTDSTTTDTTTTDSTTTQSTTTTESTTTTVEEPGPTFGSSPGPISVEANGPAGSPVNYSTPAAIDAGGIPIANVSCAPASGTIFPRGTTTVTCSATDSHGKTATTSFSVSVRDSTPPALYLPADRNVVATTAAGIAITNPAVVAFLAAARAEDIVDPHPIVTAHELPATLPVGANLITFEARDETGNKTEKTARLTVLPPGSAPVPIPPAPKPPGDVTGVKVVVGNGLAQISWGAVAGAVKYIVFRSISGTRKTSAEGHGEIVYEGTATRFTDRGLKNGTEYRYVVVSQDAAGNQSPGVAAVAVPHRDLLLSPKDGARLRKAPKLAWRRDAEADYYNAQLLLNGAKVLSVWPTRPSYTLKKSWKFDGRKYTLKPGIYKWYVWPGYGARAAVDYGELLGFRSFRIVG